MSEKLLYKIEDPNLVHLDVTYVFMYGRTFGEGGFRGAHEKQHIGSWWEGEGSWWGGEDLPKSGHYVYFVIGGRIIEYHVFPEAKE